ncbi:MAG: hypothetical protein ACLFQY_10450 [Desulfococcaceae bacterium]
MAIQGAGGTQGGIGRFFIGLVMMIGGGYLFLDAIQVTHHFHMSRALYSFGAFRLTTGLTLVPLIFGIGFIFYNAKNPIGWVLAGVSLILIGFGIISSIQFRLRHMSAFELIMILILLVGGIGLFLSSLRSFD